jgi:hypothetical protein
MLLNQTTKPRMSIDEFKEKNKNVLSFDKMDEVAAKAHREALDRERELKVSFVRFGLNIQVSTVSNIFMPSIIIFYS